MAILAAARVTAWLSYAMPRWASRSAKPMTPRPMRRIWMASWRSTGSRVAGHVDDVVEEAPGVLDDGVEDRTSASREVHVEAYVLVQTEVGAAADASGEIGALEE